jgi:hypothetical protein
MSPFLGGSAFAMANQVADGYVLVTALQLKRLSATELEQLQFELDRLLRETRGTAVAPEDMQGLQVRNRKISRLNGTLRQVRDTIAARRRGG